MDFGDNGDFMYITPLYNGDHLWEKRVSKKPASERSFGFNGEKYIIDVSPWYIDEKGKAGRILCVDMFDKKTNSYQRVASETLKTSKRINESNKEELIIEVHRKMNGAIRSCMEANRGLEHVSEFIKKDDMVFYQITGPEFIHQLPAEMDSTFYVKSSDKLYEVRSWAFDVDESDMFTMTFSLRDAKTRNLIGHRTYQFKCDNNIDEIHKVMAVRMSLDIQRGINLTLGLNHRSIPHCVSCGKEKR